MFGTCLTQVLLLHGAMCMFFLGCTALNQGVFHACSKGSCNNSLSISPCLVENNACKCPASNSSACDTLDQQAFVNLTGALNESASQWTCCLCPLDSSYCCNKCSNSTANTTAPPAIVQPTRYFRILLVFVLECKQFSKEEDNLKNSLTKGIERLTGIPLDQVTVTGTSCTTGQRPYCGVDVAGIRAHHRAKRLAVGGRMKGKSKSKKGAKDPSYTHRGSTIDLTCDSLSANITVYGKNVTSLEISINLLRHLQLNNSLVVPLWDGRVISSSFMLSAMNDASYNLHEAPTPTPKPLPPTEAMPPLEVDLKPMIYAGGALVGLISLCVLWKFIKHSWLLSRKKFTAINSDRMDAKKAQQLKQLKIMEAMEENDRISHANGSASTTSTSSLPRNNNEAMNWSSPGYPARSLAPAYKPTELHNQRSPPRLILDDDGSDIEDRRSIDSASVVNLEDEDNLSDILNSDDEQALSPSSASSRFSQGIRNPAFIEEHTTVYLQETNENRAPSSNYNNSNKMRRKSKSPNLVNGSARLSVKKSDAQDQRKESVSSDFSLDAGDKKIFLPTKKEKNKKQKKGKSFLSANAEKPVRRSSITPLSDDVGSRRNSATDVKIPQKSLAVQVEDGKGRRKSITKAAENDIRPATPKDTYSKGKKTTKAATLDNETNSVSPVNNEELDENEIGDFGKNRTKGTAGRAITPASGGDAESSGRNRTKINVKSATALNEHRSSPDAGQRESSGGNRTKINVKSATPLNEHRQSPDAGQRESSGGNRSNMNELTISHVNGVKNTIAADDTKKKKKKPKADKVTKKKAVDSDDSATEEVMAAIPQSVTGLNATPEIQRRPSVALEEKGSKAKKKKKRKDKEGKKRKTEESEASGEEDIKDETKQPLNVVETVTVETKQKKSPNETQRKKKKQKEVTAATTSFPGKKRDPGNEVATPRGKSDTPTATRMDRETNGGFIHSAKNLREGTLTVTPEMKRKKSLFIEDIENKSQTNEDETRGKSDSFEIPADWKRPGSGQSVTRMQPNSISPLPTGYKSPRLIIKPSYHKY